MPARMGRLFAGVGRRHPVTIRKASLMVVSMRRVWALRHQTGAQNSAVEGTKARVAIRRVVAPAPQPEPARQGFVVVFDFKLTFSFLVAEVEGCLHPFCSAELYLPSLEVSTNSCPVLGQHPFHCLPVSISMHNC